MPIIINLEGGFNLRDLGDIPTTDGKTTKRGVFVRSGNLDKISVEGQQKLIDYGVKTVIDLRSEWECRNYPNVFSSSSLVQYKNLPVLSDELSENSQFKAKTGRAANLAGIYRVYFDNCQQAIGTIISTVAESPSTTVFHCYAGKDRTGIVAALLLSIASVDDATIAADYAETTNHIQHLLLEWRENAIKNNRDLTKHDREVGAAAETILDSLSYIRKQYGSIEDYLQICGVTAQQILQIKNNLV
jgi:protein-tyrosine phosphatase